MPNIPFVCSAFKKHFVFIFNELIPWAVRSSGSHCSVFCSICSVSACVAVYENDEEVWVRKTAQQKCFMVHFVSLILIERTTKGSDSIFAESDCRNILISEFKLCVLRSHNGAQINCIMSVRAMLDCSYTVFGSASAWREWASEVACERVSLSLVVFFGGCSLLLLLFSFSFFRFQTLSALFVVCE